VGGSNGEFVSERGVHVDTLTGIKVFRQVVDSGGFTGAAERLDMSAAMVR